MGSEVGTTAKGSLSISCSMGFRGWLQESRISLAATTYQTNRLFLLGIKPDGSLSAFERMLDGAMGLYAVDDRLYLATRYQIWQFNNVLSSKDRYKHYDRLYVPRVAYTTGDLITHDVAVDKKENIYFINTLYSCLAATSDRHNFSVIWKPPFITKLSPEDRCHLNGLAMENGVPRYITTVSQSDIAAGWRDHRSNGGCVVDIQSNDIILDGLSMPHSPRLYKDKLWLLNSGTGLLGYVDQTTGAFEPVVFCPGYLRGLTFHDKYAIVSISKPRHNEVFAGLELDQRIENEGTKPWCGVLVVDLDSGNIVHWLRFQGAVKELYDIQVITGCSCPMALGFKSDEIKRVIGFEEKGSQVLHVVSTETDNTEHVQGDKEHQLTIKGSDDYIFKISLNMTVSVVLREFSQLTFPNLEKQAAVRKFNEPLIAVAALNGSTPIGLALAEPSTSGASARILSLFVDPAHRNNGVGGKLLSHMEKVASRFGCKELRISYHADWPNAKFMECMLAKGDWSPPSTPMLICKAAMTDIARADWLNNYRLPEKFEIFPWSELTEQEHNSIIARQSEDPWFPEVLTPFQEGDRIEHLNSLGMRYQGEVVGWMITHRTAPDTIQYTSLFVREDLQRLGRAIPLLAEALKRQMAEGIPYGVSQIRLESARMVKYMQRRCAPYMTTLTELQLSHKNLQSNANNCFGRLTA